MCLEGTSPLVLDCTFGDSELAGRGLDVYGGDTIHLEQDSLYLVRVHGHWENANSEFYLTISHNGGTTARIDLAETRLRTWFLREDQLEQEKGFLVAGIELEGRYFTGPARQYAMKEKSEELGSIEAYLETLPLVIAPESEQQFEMTFFTEVPPMYCPLAVLRLAVATAEGQNVFDLLSYRGRTQCC